MRRHRIGLILGTMNTDYPRAIRLGVQNTLESEDAILVNIADLIPYHQNHAMCAEYLRVAFELVSRLDLDVTIVPLGTVNGYLEANEDLARAMLSSVDPKKVLLLERDFEGIRCITKDGTPGMHACVRHLIEDCHFTRIAFISGPITSVGAREREGVFFEEMAAHGLPVEDGMFVRSPFSGDRPEVIEQILDRHPDVQALCCATDLIAFQAYRVLKKRGLAVGVDIAVTGFDDHPSAAHIDPPLTTVHITGYDYGCLAAREALRLCRGLPQEEKVLSSTLSICNSCGENRQRDLERVRSLIRQRPLPIDDIARLIVDSSISMVGHTAYERYLDVVRGVLTKSLDTYHKHLTDPSADDQLLSAHDFALLIPRDLSEHISLEGFHAVVVTILEAAMETGDESQTRWLSGQISELHLHIARLQSSMLEEMSISRDRREWQTFKIAEDSLSSNTNQQGAYRIIMHELNNLGIKQADLFLLREPIPVTGATRLALSDDLLHIGSIKGFIVCVEDNPEVVKLQHLLGSVMSHYGRTKVVSVAGLMAGIELMGVVVLDTGALDDNSVLMAILNMGLAVKQLQTLALERETNEILSQSNIRLRRQSHYDEMTGLLNRRGLNDSISHMMTRHTGKLASVLYLDLDGLKFINDNLGHDIGDDAIKTTAELLGRVLPEGTLASRMGGDEFVVFSLVDDESETQALMDAIQAEAEAINATHRLPFRLSVSCGMDILPADENLIENLSEAMMRADMRMYEMKSRHHDSRAFAENHHDGAKD